MSTLYIGQDLAGAQAGTMSVFSFKVVLASSTVSLGYGRPPTPVCDSASAWISVHAPTLADALRALLEEGLTVRGPGESYGYRWPADRVLVLQVIRYVYGAGIRPHAVSSLADTGVPLSDLPGLLPRQPSEAPVEADTSVEAQS